MKVQGKQVPQAPQWIRPFAHEILTAPLVEQYVRQHGMQAPLEEQYVRQHGMQAPLEFKKVLLGLKEPGQKLSGPGPMYDPLLLQEQLKDRFIVSQLQLMKIKEALLQIRKV